MTRYLPIDGLIQRFLPVIARRRFRPLKRPERVLLETERAQYREVLRRLWTARPRAHNGVVPLSSDARAGFEEWQQETQLLQEGLGSIEPALEAHIAKYATFALRITLTFHAVQVVSHEHPEARDPAAFPISITTLQQATAFLKRATQHAIVVYLNRKGVSHAYELAQAIARFVLARTAEENASGLARRDIIRRVSAYRDADERTQSRAIDLGTPSGVRRELARLYLDARHERVSPGAAAKLAYILTCLHKAIETEMVEQRIADLEKLVAHRNGV